MEALHRRLLLPDVIAPIYPHRVRVAVCSAKLQTLSSSRSSCPRWPAIRWSLIVLLFPVAPADSIHQPTATARHPETLRHAYLWGARYPNG